MIPVTNGDRMHLYGAFGLGMDYTVRLGLGMKDPVDPSVLADAVPQNLTTSSLSGLKFIRNL